MLESWDHNSRIRSSSEGRAWTDLDDAHFLMADAGELGDQYLCPASQPKSESRTSQRDVNSFFAFCCKENISNQLFIYQIFRIMLISLLYFGGRPQWTKLPDIERLIYRLLEVQFSPDAPLPLITYPLSQSQPSCLLSLLDI